MHFLFVCVPDTGHLHPLTAVAVHLQNIGHAVKVASLEEALPKVQARGLEFLSLGSYNEAEEAERRRVYR